MDYYKGLKVVHSKNHYDAVYMPEHHKAKKSSGMVYIHILQAEDILDRPLNKEECVHHKDGNKLNNDYSNLMIFATNSDHITFHHALRDGSEYELTYVNNVYYCKILASKRKDAICPCCGKKKETHSKLCFDCYKNERRKNIPVKDELIKDLCSLSILAIGKKYKVSDNAVRKWLKIYNLPCKHSEIVAFKKEHIDDTV